MSPQRHVHIQRESYLHANQLNFEDVSHIIQNELTHLNIRYRERNYLQP